MQKKRQQERVKAELAKMNGTCLSPSNEDSSPRPLKKAKVLRDKERKEAAKAAIARMMSGSKKVGMVKNWGRCI